MEAYESIIQRIHGSFSTVSLDGRECIRDMKEYEENHGVKTNWRQSEWFGWYAEYVLNHKTSGISRSHALFPTGSGSHMMFDYVDDSSGLIFDLKTSVSTSKRIITNDLCAIRNAVSQHPIGFAVIKGTATMDEDASFKLWHDTIKGRRSAYERIGETQHRKHRMLKNAVILQYIDFYVIDNMKTVDKMPIMKQGRNSNGKTRPLKMMLDTDIINPAASMAF